MDCNVKTRNPNCDCPPKVAKSKRITEKACLSPQEYIKQWSTNPENRICDCLSYHKRNSSIFSANPKIIVFQNFEVGNAYKAMLHIRNISKIPRHITLLTSETVNFSVTFRGSSLNTRLIAGMTQVYEVEFCPDEERDYIQDIVFNTDEGTFAVAVVAAGPRALLSFSDQIDMGRTAVKLEKTCPVLLQNVGDAATGFSFFTDNPYFTVTPAKGSIKPGEFLQLWVKFLPKKVGIANGHIFLRYESEDTVQSAIHGEAISCDVRVLQNSIVIEDTFLGLSQAASIQITNNSNSPLFYKWVNAKEDHRESKKCETDSLPKDLSTVDESCPFENEHFHLLPMEGEVCDTTKVKVIFKPKRVGEISAIAYLDISGQEEQLPIKLAGRCLGPTLELNILSLDVREIYLCATYSYEIVCKNSGPIPGTLVFKQKSADFGSTVKVEPSDVVITKGKLQLLRLSICSDRTGCFIERVDFVIKESSEVLSFVIKGKVVPPMMLVDSDEIDFDPIGLGFTMKKQLCFRNISNIPVDFRIRIPSDGCQPVVTHEEFARAQIKPPLSSHPREFSISPKEGTVEPFSCLPVQVSYTPNVERSRVIHMEVFMCNSLNAEPLTASFQLNAKIATFRVTPPEINIRFCFINFPYARYLTITNTSDVDAYFHIIPQKVQEDTIALYSLSTYQGYLEAGRSIETILTIIVKEVGNQEIKLNLVSLGYEAPITCCDITCKGEGPVITVEPSHLDFGETKLLERKCLILNLINDSPIAAQFNTSLCKTTSVWDVRPWSGEIEANTSMSLKVSVFLRDTGKFSDKLSIAVLNGKTMTVNLFAAGAGTSIVFNPEIFPIFDMGYLFRRQDSIIPITVRNEGTRYHYVLLTNMEKIRPTRKGCVEDNENSKFKIEPNTLEMLPGSMHTIYCKIRWDINETITEQWYVHATIDNQAKRELLGTSAFTATFVEPNVIFDKREVLFRLDFDWNCKKLQQENELEVTNQSGRHLTAHLTINPPFLMVEKFNCYTDKLDSLLLNSKPSTIKFYFPFDLENSEPLPQRYEGYLKIKYDEHKYTDKILCKAEVNFPHLVFKPSEITLYCVVGWTAEERVKLINDSPFSVCYKIKWIKESFTYESLIPPSEHGSEGSMTERSSKDGINPKCRHKDVKSPPEIKTSDDIVSYDYRLSDLCPLPDACECEEGICSCSSSGDSKNDLPSIDLIDKFLQFLPQEGQLQPYTEQEISFAFHSFERVKISIQAICEVAGGLPQLLTIMATADIVKCEIEDHTLDYGLQLFCDSAVTTLKITNQCMIPLDWNIETSSNLLRFIEGPTILDPASESIISIEKQPSAPGSFKEKLFLEITHLDPFIIDVRWMATIPQVYLDISRDSAFEKYPVEFGYKAIQMIMAESTLQDYNFLDLKCSSSSLINEEIYISQYEIIQLVDDGWQIIQKNEHYPKAIDIDMAFERVIVKDFIDTMENTSSVSTLDKTENEVKFPLTPSYTVDMGAVVVEQISQLFIELRNYGFEKAKIKMKVEKERRKKSGKSCFFVQLEKNAEICQCESTYLSIIFRPKKEIFSLNCTDVTYKCYLEVRNGLVIPVTIKALAAYPSITVNVKTLKFDKVFIGDCREMSFFLKNEGAVDCQWEICIENVSKNLVKSIESPFYIYHKSDIFTPGQEAVIKVYFKPFKNGYQKAMIIITVQNGQENNKINLVGYGIERQLKINKAEIQFPATVPGTKIIEENLIIENSNESAIELYWQHLDDFTEVNRTIRVLKHYYKTEDILIPQREIGETFPEILLNFYKSLIRQMCSDDYFIPFVKHMIKDINSDDSLSEYPNNKFKQKTKKSESNVEKADSSAILTAFMNLDQNDIETLVNAYIDKQQENPNFYNTMIDPLTELINNSTRRSIDSSPILEPEKKIVLIFHGPPSTEYQETACRTAKNLNLPLLNLNQIFLEALSLADTENEIKLIELLGKRYDELIEKLNKSADAIIKKGETNDSKKILQLVRKIPPAEELLRMDKYSLYEHMIEIISSALQSTDLLVVKGSKARPKSRPSQDNNKRLSILPDVGQDLYSNILKERLSQSTFEQGYVLQTLNNDFIKNESVIMKILLDATGKIALPLFITFNDSVELYKLNSRKSNTLIAEKEKDQEQVIRKPKSEGTQTKRSTKKLSPIHENENGDAGNKRISGRDSASDEISKAMKEYKTSLNILLDAIIEWETRIISGKESNQSTKVKEKLTLKNESGIHTPDKFFTSYIQVKDPSDRQIYDATVLYLSQYLKNIIDTNQSELQPSRPVMESRTYTILMECETSTNSFLLNNIFSISPQKRITQQLPTPILQPSTIDERSSKLSNEMRRSRAWSSSPAIPSLEEDSDLDEPILDARWALQPGESRKLRVTFTPSEKGRFKGEFTVALMNNPNVKFTIRVEGLAQVPRLDMTPGLVFDRIRNDKVTESHEPTYFFNTQTYDFGSLLVLNQENRSHTKYTQLKLRNISQVPATVTCSLADVKYENFEITRQMDIQPDETGFLNIVARATEIGKISDVMILSIEHNDEPENIQLTSTGIDLNIEIEPKQIQLGRVLLQRTETRMVTITNHSALTVYWRVSIDATELQLLVMPSHGMIKHRQSCDIGVQYYADMVKSSETKFISFDLFTSENDSEPIATEIVTISAEVYEIITEIQPDDVIDFNSLTVNSSSRSSLIIKNNGLYEIKYEILFQQVESLKSILDITAITALVENFDINPIAGSILPKKQATINISYTPSIEITLKSVPLFKCAIIEPYNDIGTVTEHPLNISTVSYHTRFSIEPQPTLNFGTVGLKSTKIMQFNIKNVGQFPLKYSIVDQSTIDRAQNETAKKRESDKLSKKGRKSKQDKTTAKRSSSIKSTSAKWGPFHFEKSRGELEPEQVDTLSIRCSSDEIGHFEEKLAIVVTDCLPVDENRPISLITDVCVAQIDFNNYNEMFAKSHILNSLGDSYCPYEFKEHTIFIKPTKTLHFRQVCVGNSYTTCITLRNTSPIPGDITIAVTDESSPSGMFEVNSNRLSVPPMTRQSFNITFAPSLIGNFTSVLKMALDLPQNFEPQSFDINLEGEGCLPQICLIETTFEDNSNPVINFGLALIFECRTKILKIKNVGQVIAKLTIEITNDLNSIYKVNIDKNEKSLLCGCIVEKYGETKLSVQMLPEEIRNIEVLFLPIKTEKYESSLNILIENNPYENHEIKLTGEGFDKPVILENLDIIHSSLLNIIQRTNSRTSTRKSRKSSIKQDTSLSRSSSNLMNQNILSYNLDYAKCFLNRMHKINFKIVNKTNNCYFRFEWNTHPNIVCIPSAGHVAPNNFKELTATFLTAESMTLLQVPLDCMINQIILEEPMIEPSWDARQTRDVWTEKHPSLSDFEESSFATDNEENIYVQKITCAIREPEYEIVPKTSQSVQLLVSAIADYSDYECDVKVINFEDTLMFQRTEKKFTLKNSGIVHLDYSWDIIMDEHYPIRLDQTELMIFSNGSNLTFKERTKPNSFDTGEFSKSENSQQKTLRIQSEETILSSGEPSDLFSSSAGLTDRSTDSWIEGENWPFQIKPQRGNLLPGENIEFTLKFCPVDVFQYKAYLHCKMENLIPSKIPLKVVIAAKSLLPYCHFDIEENDYLTSGRRDMKIPGPPGYSLVDPNIINKIRVVEFRMMGVAKCHTRYIHMINPTTDVYTFRFSKLSNELSEKQSIFQCLSTSCVAEKGKRVKISFTIIPEDVGLFESFWEFEIKKYNLKTLFLIVANVVEPSISCRNILLKLGTSTIGEIITTTFEIRNNECCTLPFCIVADSLYSEGRFQAIKVCPMSGVLKPSLSQIFNVEYQATLIGEYTFNVLCQVENLKQPILVVITTEVVEVLSKVIYIDSDHQEIEIFESRDNVINVGQLVLLQPTLLKFKIANVGRLAFDYSWNVSVIQQDTFQLSIKKHEDKVTPKSHHICCVKVIALEKVVIRDHPLSVKIKHGPTYRLKINGLAKNPPLEYSFNDYDFGACYVQTNDGIPYSVDLTITNHQKRACLLICAFENTSHIKIDLHELSQVIPPNSSVRIPIYFQPTEETDYQKLLRFSVTNTFIQKDILIKGRGIFYKIGLKNPCDAMLDFGTIAIGNLLSRKISLINEGQGDVKLQIVIIECSADDEQFTDRRKSNVLSISSSPEEENSSCSTKISHLADFIEVVPATLFTLKSDKEKQMTVKFKALQRVKSLKAKLGLKINNTILPLTVVKGSCTVASFHLNRTYISFGTVFECCTVEEKLVLVNDGDIGSKFKWNVEKLKPHFNITPINGYCSSGSEIVFACTFKPLCQSNLIQVEAQLLVEEYNSMTVNITGNCNPLPEPTEILDFTAQLRESEAKEIQIQNDSDHTWLLKPIVTGQCFITTSALSIEPKTTKLCCVTYKPRKESNQDKGKLVIILPDGRRPILYELLGRCAPTVTARKIARQVSAKKKFSETLVIYNDSEWKRVFDCRTEVLHNTKSNPPAFQVPVPAKKPVYYEFPFYFEEEGPYAYKITFDDNRGNQQCYELEFTVTASVIDSVIELTTYVRNSVFHTLKVENTSSYEEITFHANISNEDIFVHGLPATLAPLAFKNVQIEYFPLLPCDAKTKLEIQSETFGSTFYELHLVVKSALPEKPIHVKSSIGSSSSFSLAIKNYTKDTCEFRFTSDDLAFTCPTTLTVPATEEGIVDIKFEPHTLDAIDATIKATSSTAGEFTFPVIGRGTLPQPRGPFAVSSKSPASISFKNVCLETKAFEFSVDNDAFVLNTSKTSINSKQIFVITVELNPEPKTPSNPKVGKLTITCASDASLTGVKWIYYLKGVPDK